MRIMTHKSAKALKWVRIKAAFNSKGFFSIVKLLTSKSALQDSIYGSTDDQKHFRFFTGYSEQFTMGKHFFHLGLSKTLRIRDLFATPSSRMAK